MIATTATLPIRRALALLLAVVLLVALAASLLVSDVVATISSDGFLATLSTFDRVVPSGWQWVR